MDYLFYGKITTSTHNNMTTVSLCITCDADETLTVSILTPEKEHHLSYSAIISQRSPESIETQFEVPDDRFSLFTISGQNNETAIPFEVMYAVIHGEVIALPENTLVFLAGSTSPAPIPTRDTGPSRPAK